MEATRKIISDVVITPELANRLIEGLEKIVTAATEIGDAVLTLTVTTPVGPVQSEQPAAAEPRVWDLSPEALDNYDAEQLVALRADHRADNHSADGCNVCGVLVRRLGSL